MRSWMIRGRSPIESVIIPKNLLETGRFHTKTVWSLQAQARAVLIIIRMKKHISNEVKARKMTRSKWNISKSMRNAAITANLRTMWQSVDMWQRRISLCEQYEQKTTAYLKLNEIDERGRGWPRSMRVPSSDCPLFQVAFKLEWRRMRRGDDGRCCEN